MAQPGTDQHQGGVSVRNRTNHPRPAPDLTVQSLDGIVRSDLYPMLGGKVTVGQRFFDAIRYFLCSLRQLHGLQLGNNCGGLLTGCLLALLGIDRFEHLDSSPTKLIEIVRIGKQLLMTRGSLTTFSIANDVAKYFAIIPALFMGLYPGLSALNIMGLHSPQSAVLSAIIYNALIIIALIPLALKGVKYREVSAGKLLSRNLLIYGLGGLIAPFIFVKLIDVLLVMTGLV